MFRSTLILLTLATALHAEERTYSVSVDGKPAGNFAINWKTQSDEVTEIRAKIDLTDSRHYSLKYDAVERWQSGRVLRLEGSGAEGRRKGSVALIGTKHGYSLKSDSKEVTVRGDVWPTTFWVLPAAENPLVVDVLSGEVSRSKLEKVGVDRMPLNGKPIRVTKYRLTFAGTTVELWYDQADRLTRRKWDANGRTIVTELTDIKFD